MSSRHPFFPSSPQPHTLTLGDGQLVEPDVVHDRLHLPVLQERVPGHLTEVHHPCWREDTGAQCRCQGTSCHGDTRVATAPGATPGATQAARWEGAWGRTVHMLCPPRDVVRLLELRVSCSPAIKIMALKKIAWVHFILPSGALHRKIMSLLLHPLLLPSQCLLPRHAQVC